VEGPRTVVEVECITHVYPDLTMVQICRSGVRCEPGERVCYPRGERVGKQRSSNILWGFLVRRNGTVKVFGMDPGQGLLEDQAEDRGGHAGCG